MDDLALALRDIRLPPEPPLWPPAPGWWAVLALLALVLAAVVWLVRRRRRVRRAALAELRRLEVRWRQDGDAAALARGLSILLRRVALATAPRREVAGLTGAAWLAWLGLPDDPGRLLLTLPYGGPGAERAGDLLAAVRRWVRGRPC